MLMLHRRPIAAYGALDLPTSYIDLTPFVPILTDGMPHNITMDVVSAEPDHSLNQNWYLTANLQIVTDPKSTKRTTGRITKYEVQPFAQTTTTGSAANSAVSATVSAARNVHIEADIVSGSGEKTHVVWSQSLSFSNVQTYHQNGSVQVRSYYADCTCSTIHLAARLCDSTPRVRSRPHIMAHPRWSTHLISHSTWTLPTFRRTGRIVRQCVFVCTL